MATEYADLLLADGDLVIGEDVSVIDTNLLSLKQRLDLRFAIWQSEWKYDESYGTPYRDYIGLSVDKSSIDQEIKRQILKETDVVELSGLYSVINKQLRLYTFIAEVSTNEATLTYSLNLKDSFEYEIPKYSSGCDKIVPYQYWSSAPYDVLAEDGLSPYPQNLSGTLREVYKVTENLNLGAIPTVGAELRNILYIHAQPNEDRLSGDIGMSLSDVTFIPNTIYKTQDQPNEDRLSGDIGMELTSTALTLAIRYITQDQPCEDKLSGDVSMELTTATLTKTI